MASRSKKGQSPRFLIGSAVIHLAILGVILLSPAREYIFEREQSLKPEIIARDDRLEELMEEVRDQTVERLQERVEILAEGQDRMAGNFETINAHLQPFQEMQTATARDRFEQYAETTTSLQKQLLELLESSPRTLAEWNAAEAEARQLTARLLSTQEEIRRGMMILGYLDAELLEQQAGTEREQFTVGQSLRELAEALSEEERRSAQLQRDQATLATAVARIAELNAELPPAEQALAQAKADEKKLLAEPDETDTRKRREQNGQRNRAKRQVVVTEKKVNALTGDITRTTAGRDSRIEAIATVKQRLEELELRQAELLKQSRERQLAATELQRSVIDQIQSTAPSTTAEPMQTGEL